VSAKAVNKLRWKELWKNVHFSPGVKQEAVMNGVLCSIVVNALDL